MFNLLYFYAGYSPRVPDSLIVDNIQPKLTRWFVDRSTSNTILTMYVFFTEPVTLLNATQIVLCDSDLSTYSGSSVSFNVRNYVSKSVNSSQQLVLTLSDYCKHAYIGNRSLDSSVESCSGTRFYSFLNNTAG